MKKSMHISSNLIETLNLLSVEMCLTAYFHTKVESINLSEDNWQTEYFGTLEYNGNKRTMIKQWGRTVAKENNYWKGKEINYYWDHYFNEKGTRTYCSEIWYAAYISV